MTDSESNKKNAKGFAGLSSRVSDVSEDAPPAARAPQAAPHGTPAAGSAPPRPPSAEQSARGFAGLSSKVSDVSEDAARAAEARQAIPPAPPAPDARPSQPARAAQKSAQVESSPAPSKSGKTGWAWVVACVAVFVIWMANSGSGNHGQSPAASDATTTLTPMAPGAALDGAAPAVSDERMPPVGRNNVLGIPEIRWCKREKIRIDAIEGLVANAQEREVGTFNAKVDDYNSRCAEFRYRRGQVEQVDRELESQRGWLASTAQMQWTQAWMEAPDARSASPSPAERADEPEPSAFGSGWGAKPEPAHSQMDISQDEQESIDSACGGQKTLYGQAAYDKCVSKKTAALKNAPRNIDLTALSASERESIESACGGQRTLEGPAAYNACLSSKLAALKAGPRDIDLSALSPSERESMESACAGQKILDGPATYNRCLSTKLASLKGGPRNVDLSNLSGARRDSIESACAGQKLLEGPAAYNRCLTQKIRTSEK